MLRHALLDPLPTAAVLSVGRSVKLMQPPCITLLISLSCLHVAIAWNISPVPGVIRPTYVHVSQANLSAEPLERLPAAPRIATITSPRVANVASSHSWLMDGHHQIVNFLHLSSIGFLRVRRPRESRSSFFPGLSWVASCKRWVGREHFGKLRLDRLKNLVQPCRGRWRVWSIRDRAA